MLWPNFIGPAYRARSSAIAADTLKNLYTEVSENPADIKQANYYGTPGLKFLLSVITQGCRGLFSQDGVTLTAIGAMLYSVNVAAGTTMSLGPIKDDGQLVFFASNGRGGEQVAIQSGGQLQVLNLTTLTLSGVITLPLTNSAAALDFIDGYFVLSETNTVRVWFSALEDGTLWDALDFFAVSLTSSNVVGLKVIRDRIWILQSQTALVYYDSGDADNPFVPYPGSVMQEGAVNAVCIAGIGESIFWVAQDNQGGNRMVSASDYAPAVISTPPISFALASYPTTTTIEALAYEQEGHAFVIWTVPGQQTWGYDVRSQQWHERTTFNEATGISQPWRVRGCCSVDGLIVVGDAVNGNLYTLDLDTFTENGDTIERERSAPYPSGENQWLFIDRVELGMQSGVGLVSGQGVMPEAMLSISLDSGNTWTPPVTASLGEVGVYGARAIWRRLGRARGDRLVIKIRSTDPVRQVWGPGLWLKARAGSGAL